MLSGVTKYRFHQVRSAVCGLGLIGKVWLRSNEHAQFDDAFNPFEVTAQCGLHLCDQHDAARFGCNLGVFQIACIANPAC